MAIDYKKIKGKTLGCVPCRDISIFQEKYEELLQNIIEQGKIIGVIGLPIIQNNSVKLLVNLQLNDIRS